MYLVSPLTFILGRCSFITCWIATHVLYASYAFMAHTNFISCKDLCSDVPHIIVFLPVVTNSFHNLTNGFKHLIILFP